MLQPVARAAKWLGGMTLAVLVWVIAIAIILGAIIAEGHLIPWS